ncbi:thioredoxin domain-containing protein [Salinisphaera sp. SPP-AMP-43]|uniref:thioredoxin domain-containing protein n=1 Tax=Salinisphaera sp. SPP-AMP-43 TaxID=3121288 RepID=UPI003C6E6F0F
MGNSSVQPALMAGTRETLMASAAELRAIRERRQDEYTVRTRFVDTTGEPRYVNHLIGEDSPYLLQHAHNPVAWYPWGRTAFDKAKAEHKPVFLSIGYSTCHWCHVMEEESFDDEDVADFLNRHFISIKVDREQRPDLDEYYMAGVQIVTGRGGWPMSSLLLPDGRPFFGGTYFPKAQFLGLLDQARQAWQNQPGRLHTDAEQLDQGIHRQLAPAAEADLPDDLIDRVLQALIDNEDSTHGGFGTAPKFPQEPNLCLLIDCIARDPRPLAEQPAWATLSRALDAMLAGGFYDQIGGGFHRYATDAGWQVPHFEKMLYNQAQLADVYLAAWRVSNEPAYRCTAEATLDYVLREMQAPDGGFYSATDADSEGEEGRYFFWRHNELADALDTDELAFCETVFGATRGGNFEGANILHRPQPLTEAARKLGLSAADFEARRATIQHRLYQIREQRPKPLRDDKYITEWNGMLVAALARAGRILERTDYREAAARAADYIWRVHHDKTAGRLWRTSLYGQASVAAQLEDYAHLLDGLIALYDATEDSAWLDRARTLLAEARAYHWDSQTGGFFGPPQTDEPQPLRSKSLMDNATISGNSLMPSVLLALHERTGDADILALADAQITSFSGHIARLPLAGPAFLQGLMHRRSGPAGPLQYFGDGAIRAEVGYRAQPAGSGQVVVALSIRDGWHIQPIGEASDATRLHIIGAEPALAEVVDVPSDRPLSGRIELALAYPWPALAPLIVELILQPCTDRECLPPETRRFSLHAPAQTPA